VVMSDERIPYDHLVIAVGSVPHPRRCSGWSSPDGEATW
jgi:NADH dehydrogenase FAD-containing subunit